jgi:hypothetical protein
MKLAVFLIATVLGLALGLRLTSPAQNRTEATKPAEFAAPTESMLSFKAVEKPLLRWSDVESTNLTNHVANLRAIGCPEEVIRDVLRDEVKRILGKKFALTMSSTNVPIVPSQRMEFRSREHARMLTAVDSTLYNDLGIEREAFDTFFFTAAQEHEILRANALYPRISTDPSDPASVEQARQNKIARHKYLAGFLSPELLEYYALAREGEAHRVAAFLRAMQPTQQEFLNVFRALNNQDATFQNGRFSPELETRLKAALGPERFAKLVALKGSD